jgi:hypothetical protein
MVPDYYGLKKLLRLFIFLVYFQQGCYIDLRVSFCWKYYCGFRIIGLFGCCGNIDRMAKKNLAGIWQGVILKGQAQPTLDLTMKLNLPHSDNQLVDAIHRAKRAGMNEDKVYDMTADSIIQSFIGDNPPTREDLMNGEKICIGRNSSAEWYGIVTGSGRYILYTIAESDMGFDDPLDEPFSGWNPTGTHFYSVGYSTASREIKAGDRLPSYIGHY